MCGDLTSRPLNLLWSPDGELDLTTRHLGLNLDWGGGVQGHVNTRTNDLTSEWRDNTIEDPCGGDSGGPILAERNNKSCIFGTVLGNGYNCRTDSFSEIEGGMWNDMLSMREKLNKKIEMKIRNSLPMRCDSEETGLDQNR